MGKRKTGAQLTVAKEVGRSVSAKISGCGANGKPASSLLATGPSHEPSCNRSPRPPPSCVVGLLHLCPFCFLPYYLRVTFIYALHVASSSPLIMSKFQLADLDSRGLNSASFRANHHTRGRQGCMCQDFVASASVGDSRSAPSRVHWLRRLNSRQ